MTIYTKLFIINIILIIGVLVLDKYFIEDVIEKNDTAAGLAGLWVICTWISVPVYFSYFIWMF